MLSLIHILMVNLTTDPMVGMTVVPGMSEGLKMLNKGAKAKLYIPSPLAYGAPAAGPDIKPNSILVFDFEVINLLT